MPSLFRRGSPRVIIVSAFPPGKRGLSARKGAVQEGTCYCSLGAEEGSTSVTFGSSSFCSVWGSTGLSYTRMLVGWCFRATGSLRDCLTLLRGKGGVEEVT